MCFWKTNSSSGVDTITLLRGFFEVENYSLLLNVKEVDLVYRFLDLNGKMYSR